MTTEKICRNCEHIMWKSPQSNGAFVFTNICRKTGQQVMAHFKCSNNKFEKR